MAARSRPQRGDVDRTPPSAPFDVSALQSSPGRTVFIESGNTDGWISTDHAVELAP